MLDSKGSDKFCKKRTYLYPINLAFPFFFFFFLWGVYQGLNYLRMVGLSQPPTLLRDVL